jgi:hypothetical protein
MPTAYPDGEPLTLSLSRFQFPLMVAEIAGDPILVRRKDFPRSTA